MSIFTYNGAAIIAMAGKDCVAIGSDLRFGVQLQTMTTDYKKVYQLHDRLFVGLGGLATDAQTLYEKLVFRHNMYKLREERDMKPSTFGNLLSSMLYEKRFGPFFAAPVVAGLEPDGKPFICGMDSIGALETAVDFIATGTNSESLFGMCESMWRPDMDADELFETLAQCLLSGIDRDALAGWGAVVYVIDKDKGRKKDVFDAEDFQPAKFINQIYPDEASLGDLDKFVDMLRKQIKSVDKEIFSAVRQQAGSQARSRQDLGVAAGQVGELFGRVRDIQRKAADTEVLVQEICRDIRKLDYAKRHLTSTITSLRRLAMLTAAVDDLEHVGYRRDQYKRCANLLEAVGQLMEHFEKYRDLPKIATLTRRLEAVQGGLQEAVMDDFKLLLGTSETRLSPENAERLSNACLVVNALGPKVRDGLMDWLCDREMTVYQTIFSMSGDAAKLDRFERRFVWFKTRLEERKEIWGLFPPAWRVPQTLCLTFCKITKACLKRILSDSEDVIAADVGPLLKTVVATNKFEREMAAAFGGGGAGGGGEDDADELQDIDNLPASEARRRLEAFRKRQQAAAAAKAAAAAAAASGEDGSSGGAPDAAAVAAAARGAFEGAISEAFEGALKFYVTEEQKELFRYLDQLIREEAERKWLPPDDGDGGAAGTRVLGSANQLFLKIRASLQRCVKLVSRGQTLLGLAGAFKRVLAAYAAELMKRLPKTAAGGTSAAPPYIGAEWHVRLPEDEEAVVETIEGLAAAISKDLRPPSLADGLDLGGEEGAFSGVASACLNALVLGLNTRLDAPLQARTLFLGDMLRMRWDAFEAPGDDSPFVGAMRKVLAEVAPRLGSALDGTQFGFFCDKAGRMISEKGTLQLSIDTDSVRRLLLEFPRAAGGGGGGGDTAGYVHYVEREMGGAVNLVKVLQAKPENLLDTFILLMPASQKGAADFARGFTKKLQSELLVQFARKTGSSLDPLAAIGAGSFSSGPGAAGALGGGVGLGGGGGGSGSGGGNLSALKSSVNSFTRELASSMSLGPRGGTGGGGGAGGGGGGGDGGGRGGDGKPSALFRPGAGLGFSMGQTAGRAREGLAKMLPGKFGGEER
ncbi:MAG: subunit of GARP complex [Monoraphidium minutum]|nr:MAG: subunit of GARP complex [Monoraphidium minutum]